MKFSFTPSELEYLHEKVTMICKALHACDVETGLARTVHKIRYKFMNNALACFLSKKEREFLLVVLGYRQNALVKVNSISEELDLIQALIRKVEL